MSKAQSGSWRILDVSPDWEIFSHRWIFGVEKSPWENRLLLKIFLIKMQKTSKTTLEVSMICVTFGEAHDIFKDVII